MVVPEDGDRGIALEFLGPEGDLLLAGDGGGEGGGMHDAGRVGDEYHVEVGEGTGEGGGEREEELVDVLFAVTTDS